MLCMQKAPGSVLKIFSGRKNCGLRSWGAADGMSLHKTFVAQSFLLFNSNLMMRSLDIMICYSIRNVSMKP